MLRHNACSKGAYITDHICWGLMTMVWYRTFLYRPIPTWSNGPSKLLLWGLWAAALLGGYAATARRRRNATNLTVTLLLPYEVYTALSLGRYFKTGIALSLAAAAAAGGGFLLLALLASPRRRVLARRVRLALLRFRAAAAVCMGSVLIFSLITAIHGGIPFWGEGRPANVPREEATIAACAETLCKLEEDVWQGLSTGEKLRVLQAVADIERSRLGLSHDLSVRTDLLGDGTLGSYRGSAHQITIDTTHLEQSPPQEVLRSVVHECYHAYQQALVALYLASDEAYRSLQVFDAARAYAEEYADYQDGQGDTFLAYYAQAVEVTARAYAESAVASYRAELGLADAGAALEAAG